MSTRRRASRSSSTIFPAGCASPGRSSRPADLLLLGRERERVRERPLDLLAARPTGCEPADRLGILDQLVRRHHAPGRRTPTTRACAPGRGSRAAVRSARWPRASSRSRSAARSAFSGGVGFGGFCSGAARQRPERLDHLIATLQQPVAQLVASRCSPRGCSRRSAAAAHRRAWHPLSKTTIDVPPSLTSARRSSRRNASSSFSAVAGTRGPNAVPHDALAGRRTPRGAADRRVRAHACRTGPSGA